MYRLPAVLLACAALLASADADLILHNGKIVTADGRFGIQQAVAIKSGTIVAVGPDGLVLKAERSPKTEVIDLHGRTVLPGLVDAHVHALEAGLSEYHGPIPPLDSFAAVQDYIRRQAAKTPKGAWIVVPRTFPTRLKEMRMPTRDLMDVERDHPVLFDASYVVILNSVALKQCGIDRNTPNPAGGDIVKDANGEPTGVLKNAQSLVKGLDHSEHFTETEKLDALEQQLKRYLAAGLTTVGDRAVNAEQISLYQKLKAAGRLPIRAVLTWRPDGSQPSAALEQQIESAPYTTNTGDSWLKFGSFKLTLDGGMTIGTAFQRYPYGPFGKQLYENRSGRSRPTLHRSR